jgi:hypothetical protein
MTNKIHHSKFFLDALRSALLFIAGFLTYEILKTLESEWNKTHENREVVHFAKRKSYHFLAIFFLDLFILYIVAVLFKVHL